MELRRRGRTDKGLCVRLVFGGPSLLCVQGPLPTGPWPAMLKTKVTYLESEGKRNNLVFAGLELLRSHCRYKLQGDHRFTSDSVNSQSHSI